MLDLTITGKYSLEIYISEFIGALNKLKIIVDYLIDKSNFRDFSPADNFIS